MIEIVLALLGLAVGFGLGWRFAWPQRSILEGMARRSRALYELAEGDRLNVASELEAMCQSEPGDTAVFLALGALDRAGGRIDRAKAVHRTVLASSKLSLEHRVAALVGLGRDLLAQGNERAAVGALVRAASLAPRSSATLETLARALEQAGAWDRSAAAWERLEKQVDGRRAREARIGRGHALAAQAQAALEEGEAVKARKLAERSITFAPDSGHVWSARARVEASEGEHALALEAWQRAWELAPGAAHVLVAEAWEWAQNEQQLPALTELMLASLRIAQEPGLLIALSEKLFETHAEETVAVLQRMLDRSPELQLWMCGLLQRTGQSEKVEQLLARAPLRPALSCRRCGEPMPNFRFRCRSCGSWDSASASRVGGDADISLRSLG